MLGFQMSILKIEVIRYAMMRMGVLDEKDHAFRRLIGQNMIDLAIFIYKIREREYYIFSYILCHSHTRAYSPPTTTHPSSSLKYRTFICPTGVENGTNSKIWVTPNCVWDI